MTLLSFIVVPVVSVLETVDDGSVEATVVWTVVGAPDGFVELIVSSVVELELCSVVAEDSVFPCVLPLPPGVACVVDNVLGTVDGVEGFPDGRSVG